MQLSVPLNRTISEPILSKSLFGSRYWLVALILSITMHLLILHGLPWLNQTNLEPAGMQQITASFKTLANPTPSAIPAFEPPLPEIPPKPETPIKPIKPEVIKKPVIDKPILQSTEIATPKDFAVEQAAEATEQDEITPPNQNQQPTVTPSDNQPVTNTQSAPATTNNTNPISTPSPSARTSQDDGLLDAYGRDLQRLCERNKQYPAIAIRRNLEGSGTVLVIFNKEGAVLRISIEQSTGEKSLDDQAMKMVEKSLNSLPLPSKLNGKVMTLSVPVSFALHG
jgi:periplasmic protein TonB